MKITKLLYSIVFMLLSLSVFAQQQGQQPKKDKVELQGADNLEGGIFNGQRITKLIGNVVFKQNETFLHADSVYRYSDGQVLEAFGNVRVAQGDSISMSGSRATYDGNKRTARMSGNVVMRDPRMTLTTPSLDYDLNTRTATYTEGGTIVDPENRLESRRGSYDTKTNMYTFQQNVKVFSAEYNITAQNLKYNTQSKIVYFQGPTYIKGQQGDLYAEEGNYNTITKISNFGRNAYILTPEYRLGGDKLYYDQARGYGYAEKNVSLRSLKDDVTIRGNVGRYWRDRGVAKVYGSPVMETIMDKDTLYMSADTLMSQESKNPKMPSMLYAYNKVKIFKSDLQGKCDSLSYNRTDSVMYMNVKPVLWSEESQMVSDTIRIHLRNKTIDRMFMFGNAFITSEDTLKNYNQVKGRDMVAFFQKGNIRRVNVNGNGESLYFALEGDSTLTGMNKAICSDMVLKFAENKLKSISFLVNPDASFIPPHELKEPDRKLEGFNWMADLRPTKKTVFSKRAPAAPKAKKQAASSTKKGKATTKQKKAARPKK
ncbi:OstA-like protein [Pontibacter vulgaris]|uniref:OstA-like protein n=1 Tax=Pontibacter vulgaris TaxID=2905679 RepID=UPI001FA71A46|nr:OstA-like protein [Pontibacter vulgaris]